MGAATGSVRRSLHVLDLEYIGQGPGCNGTYLAEMVRRYRIVSETDTILDLTIGAASHYVYKRVAFDLPTDMRKLPAGRGPDAADRKLLAEVDPEDAAHRFDQVVIGSGDHIFAKLARAVARAGARTMAVGYAYNMSRELAAAVDEVRYLDDWRLAA